MLEVDIQEFRVPHTCIREGVVVGVYQFSERVEAV